MQVVMPASQTWQCHRTLRCEQIKSARCNAREAGQVGDVADDWIRCCARRRHSRGGQPEHIYTENHTLNRTELLVFWFFGSFLVLSSAKFGYRLRLQFHHGTELRSWQTDVYVQVPSSLQTPAVSPAQWPLTQSRLQVQPIQPHPTPYTVARPHTSTLVTQGASEAAAATISHSARQRQAEREQPAVAASRGMGTGDLRQRTPEPRRPRLVVSYVLCCLLSSFFGLNRNTELKKRNRNCRFLIFSQPIGFIRWKLKF